MKIFSIVETDGFLKDLENDFQGRKQQILQKLNQQVYSQLSRQPFHGKHIKKLKDYSPETWRYRIGDYRFFYEIDQNKRSVVMIAADHRSGVY